jgi:hypothetical protein
MTPSTHLPCQHHLLPPQVRNTRKRDEEDQRGIKGSDVDLSKQLRSATNSTGQFPLPLHPLLSISKTYFAWIVYLQI